MIVYKKKKKRKNSVNNNLLLTEASFYSYTSQLKTGQQLGLLWPLTLTSSQMHTAWLIESLPSGTATTVCVSSGIPSKAHCFLLDATGTTKKTKTKQSRNNISHSKNIHGVKGVNKMVKGDLSDLALQAELSLNNKKDKKKKSIPTFLFKVSLFFAPLCLPCLSCGVKVKLCGSYRLQSRGVHLRLRAEEWRREVRRACSPFTTLSLFLCLALSSVGWMTSEHWMTVREDRQGKVWLGQWVRGVDLFQSAVGGNGCSERA